MVWWSNSQDFQNCVHKVGVQSSAESECNRGTYIGLTAAVKRFKRRICQKDSGVDAGFLFSVDLPKPVEVAALEVFVWCGGGGGGGGSVCVGGCVCVCVCVCV